MKYKLNNCKPSKRYTIMFSSLVKRVVVGKSLPTQQIRNFSVNLRSNMQLVSSTTTKINQNQSMSLIQKRNVSRWQEGMEVIGKEPMFWPKDDPNSEYRKTVKSRVKNIDGGDIINLKRKK